MADEAKLDDVMLEAEENLNYATLALKLPSEGSRQDHQPGYLMVIEERDVVADTNPETGEVWTEDEMVALNEVSLLNPGRATLKQVKRVLRRLRHAGLVLKVNKEETTDSKGAPLIRWYVRVQVLESELMRSAEEMEMWKRLKDMNVPVDEGSGRTEKVRGGYVMYSISRADGHVDESTNINLKFGLSDDSYGGIFERPDMTDTTPDSLFTDAERLEIIMWKMETKAGLDIIYDGEGRDGKIELWSKGDDDEWNEVADGLLYFKNLSPTNDLVRREDLRERWALAWKGLFSPWYNFLRIPNPCGRKRTVSQLEETLLSPEGRAANPWTALRQPLRDIKEYYGVKVGLYFAFIGHLLSWLWAPAALGVIVFTQQSTFKHIPAGKQVQDTIWTPIYCVFLIVWATLFLEFWKRRNFELALDWGTNDYENEPVFRRDWLKAYDALYHTDDPGEVEDFKVRQMASNWCDSMTGGEGCLPCRTGYKLRNQTATVIVFFAMALVLGIVWGVLVFRLIMVAYKARYNTFGYTIGVWSAGMLNGVSIMLAGFLYKTVANKLTEWENHRTDIEHEDALIAKTFAFEFVNNYSSLFYIAFLKKSTSMSLTEFYAPGGDSSSSCHNGNCCVNGNCMYELATQLAMILFIKSIFYKLLVVAMPKVKKLFGRAKALAMKEEVVDKAWYVEEDELEEYEDVTDEYKEIAIMYGYIILFAAAFPLAPLLSLVTTSIEMRTDAWKILASRRPYPRKAADIGTWAYVFEILTTVSILTNIVLVVFTSNAPVFPSTWSSFDKLMVVVVTEHIVLIVRWALQFIVADISRESLHQLSMQQAKYALLHRRIKYIDYDAYYWRRLGRDGQPFDYLRIPKEGGVDAVLPSGRRYHWPVQPMCDEDDLAHYIPPGKSCLSKVEMATLGLKNLLRAEEKLEDEEATRDDVREPDAEAVALDAHLRSAELGSLSDVLTDPIMCMKGVYQTTDERLREKMALIAAPPVFGDEVELSSMPAATAAAMTPPAAEEEEEGGDE